MKLVFDQIGRFVWLRWLLGIGLVVVLFYLEEDWRGAHMWAETKAEWEAKGESFDRTKFIPPPVPDEQNLAALPLFKLGPMKDKLGTAYLGLPTLSKAMRDGPPLSEIPSVGSWSKGELPDLAKIRAEIASDYAAIFKDAKLPVSALAQFDAIYPFLDELRSVSASRPLFRLNLDYLADPPYQRGIQPVVELLRVSRLLSVHAVLALHEKHSDLALADLQLGQQLLNGARQDPSMTGGYVAIAMRAYGNAIIYDGLSEHVWSDAELVQIEATLKPIDFLGEYQFAMRSDLIASLSMIDAIRDAAQHPGTTQDGMHDDEATAATYFADGWWDDNKRYISIARFCTVRVVNPKAQRVFPNVALDLNRRAIQAAETWIGAAPWNLFAASVASPYANLPLQRFAEAQVSVDETRIACALERFRLAHGVYPATLAELAPAYIDAVPHDIMNGEPYHYRVKADGTFLLYSVGWNQADDGGTVIFKEGDPKTIDYEKGDWVWPTAKVGH
jgi:hypothetical protein